MTPLSEGVLIANVSDCVSVCVCIDLNYLWVFSVLYAEMLYKLLSHSHTPPESNIEKNFDCGCLQICAYACIFFYWDHFIINRIWNIIYVLSNY